RRCQAATAASVPMSAARRRRLRHSASLLPAWLRRDAPLLIEVRHGRAGRVVLVAVGQGARRLDGLAPWQDGPRSREWFGGIAEPTRSAEQRTGLPGP